MSRPKLAFPIPFISLVVIVLGVALGYLSLDPPLRMGRHQG